MSQADRRGGWFRTAAMSVRTRSLYPFVLAALCERVPPERRASTRVLDIPAGDGVLSFALAAGGFEVTPMDLFPEYFEGGRAEAERSGLGAVALFDRMAKARTPAWLAERWLGEGWASAPSRTGLTASPADMESPLPAPEGSFDAAVCVEGIEHVMDRHRTLQGLRRVLRPGGRLFITTPNLLSLRARAAYALAGQRAFKSYIDEYTSVWGVSPDRTRVYHGHAFLVTYFQLRYSLHHCGFRVESLWPSNWSPMSVVLSPLAPLVAAATWMSQRRAKKRFEAWKGSGAIPADATPPYGEMFRHLLGTSMLFNSTLIVEARAV